VAEDIPDPVCKKQTFARDDRGRIMRDDDNKPVVTSDTSDPSYVRELELASRRRRRDTKAEAKSARKPRMSASSSST